MYKLILIYTYKHRKKSNKINIHFLHYQYLKKMSNLEKKKSSRIFFSLNKFNYKNIHAKSGIFYLTD